MSPYLKHIQPPLSEHHCAPPQTYDAGLGSLWKCDYKPCGKRWEMREWPDSERDAYRKQFPGSSAAILYNRHWVPLQT